MKGKIVTFIGTGRRRVIVIGGALVLIAGAAYALKGGDGAMQFVTAPVSKGDVVRAIVTTGTVNPLTTVQVGTYVSGTIEKLSCDFNTRVKAGQVCALIDQRPYRLAVDQAAANLAAAEAQMRKDEAGVQYARLKHQRDLTLQKKDFVSQDAVDLSKNALDQALAQVAFDRATVRQRQAALNAAQVNLNYTKIVSPVDGVVVSRSIDVGQTVAASFQTPTLFLIAEDLTKMQIDTSVSESDVAGAKVGQAASFTVEAYPGRTFKGEVTQVRKAPITVQNVVTYNVVIGVPNPESRLLPGMTANTKIVSDARRDVLRVPVQALRFQLDGAGKGPKPDGGGWSGGGRPGGGEGRSGKGDRGKGAGDSVYLLRDGKPVKVAVTAGLSDGTNTEISGADIHDGDQVIVNAVRPGGDEAKSRSGSGRPRMGF